MASHGVEGGKKKMNGDLGWSLEDGETGIPGEVSDNVAPATNKTTNMWYVIMWKIILKKGK